nr:MFS transporter [Burkholderia sp. TSV86]
MNTTPRTLAHDANATALAHTEDTIDERRARRRTVAAAALGNGLEFFDFTVYSFFAALIGKLFFPATTDIGALMVSLATFGVGFVARPLGSIAIGAYADRAGRKPALVLTVGLMALGTGMIGFAPTYAAIGVAAPVLVVTGRLLQGFSAGGEVGAATTLLMESGGARRRGEMVSWQMASQGAAALVGAFVAAALSRLLPHDALMSWGWRVPFVFGLLIGPLGFYLRRHLDDTLHQAVAAAEAHGAAAGMPAAPSRAARISWRQIMAGTLLVVGGTSTMYTIVFSCLRS